MAGTITVKSGKTYLEITGEEERSLRYIVRAELGQDCERLLDDVLERAWSAGQDQYHGKRDEREDLIEKAQTIKNHCEGAECEACRFYAKDRDVCTLCKRVGPSEWDFPENHSKHSEKVARGIAMDEQKIMEHLSAIKEWCDSCECDKCHFYECRLCTLRDCFPYEWELPTFKTFADVMLEKFPKIALDMYGTPFLCVHKIFGQDATGCDLDSFEAHPNMRDVCSRCWKKVAPKEYQGRSIRNEN